MKSSHLIAGVLTLAAALLASPGARAQDPVSPGEPWVGGSSGSSDLTGTVVTQDGESIPGVTIELRAPDGTTRTFVTDANGRFDFSGLPAGEYVVTASLSGFSTESREVSVRPGQTAELTLSFGGPVSPGEPWYGGGHGSGGSGGGGEEEPPEEPPPSPAPPPPPADSWSGSVTVVEKRFADDLDLQAWLDQESLQGRELRAVVPLTPEVSLFVLREVAGPARCIVILDPHGRDRVDAARLATRIEQHSDKAFLGIHWVGSGAALVFRDGR